jgi:ubiquinone/menaquinone biosynthesis C-methylase UbiE
MNMLDIEVPMIAALNGPVLLHTEYVLLCGTVNLSNPRATFAGPRPRFTRSRVTYEAYVVSRTSTRPQVDSALEVAVGTGLNLPAYPNDIALTGIDWSDAMLDIARSRATELGRTVTLEQADAQRLPFGDGSFDTVVCTFGLCAITDHNRAVAEMSRVLRPDGRLILVDHIESTSRVVRAVQRFLEIFTVPLDGEHFLRRPLNIVQAAGFTVERVQRFNLGLVERLVARKT